MEHKERKEEIIQVSKKLFLAKGYSKTTVNDIIQKMDIAKGTFYYYFKSKEDVLNNVVEVQVQEMLSRIEKIRNQENSSLQEQMLGIIREQSQNNEADQLMLRDMHKLENVLMLKKYTESMIHAITPALSDIIQKGNRCGLFHASYPDEYVEILLVSASVLTDENWIRNGQKEKKNMVAALYRVLELMLGVEEGSLS